MKDVEFVVITGLSGAGKTSALRALEDQGFYCMDNLPPTLVVKFAELCLQPGGGLDRIAMVCDIRGGEFFNELFFALRELENLGVVYQILFLEASDDVLVRRYKETRRRHPMAPEGGVLEGIAAERARLGEVRGRAHIVIDTSDLSVTRFREQMNRIFGHDRDGRLLVTVLTFGYKYGLPTDADLVFDVRFLPNPFYVEALKQKGGDSPEVKEYVMKWPTTRRFLGMLVRMMRFLLPQYLAEGKSQVRIAIGCTGGQHRSVVIGSRLAEILSGDQQRVIVEHRDMARALAGVNRV